MAVNFAKNGALIRSFMAVLAVTTVSLGQIGAQEKNNRVETDIERSKRIEAHKLSIVGLEQQAAEKKWSAKSNGVELAIKVRPIANKNATDIEVAWTITYSGPRPPLIIVQPSLELTTGSTMVNVLAAPKEKSHAFPFTVLSAREGRDHVVDAYGTETPLPARPPNGISTLPMMEMPRTRTKDWFITVAQGKAAHGAFAISGDKLKKYLMSQFPGEFVSKGL
jgi:hypothetical protein